MLFLSWMACIFAESLTKALVKKSIICSDRGKFEGVCNKSLQFYVVILVGGITSKKVRLQTM